MVWLVGGVAFAAEVETWFGGHLTTGAQAVSDAGATSFGTILSQAEFDARAATGPWFFRLDLDYHFDPYFFGVAGQDWTIAPHYPLTPEYAVVQVGEKWHLRAGVTNPDFGLQEWDEKDNYLATYSNGWDLANGQNLGLEPGITFGDGTDLFVFGGYDMAWLTPSAGAGVQTEQDLFGTWSGFFAMPLLGYGMLVTANELYPLDQLYLSLELNAGLVAGQGWLAGGQVVANVMPESVVGGAVRAELQEAQSDAVFTELGVVPAPYAVTAGLRVDPTDWLHVAADAGLDGPAFVAALLVAVQFPGEPYEDFAVVEEEEE